MYTASINERSDRQLWKSQVAEVTSAMGEVVVASGKAKLTSDAFGETVDGLVRSTIATNVLLVESTELDAVI